MCASRVCRERLQPSPMNGTRQGEYVDTKYVHSGSVFEENCIGMRTAALRQLCVQVPSCRTCLSRGHACDPQRMPTILLRTHSALRKRNCVPASINVSWHNSTLSASLRSGCCCLMSTQMSRHEEQRPKVQSMLSRNGPCAALSACISSTGECVQSTAHDCARLRTTAHDCAFVLFCVTFFY